MPPHAPLPTDVFTDIPAERLRSARVRLRPWRDADLAPFGALNADPQVMAHFPTPLTAAASMAMATKIRQLIGARGWGFWAADSLEGAQPQFMGFVGLHTPAGQLPFTPCVEIGWRLARPFWGRGLAAEGAQLALRAGFEDLQLPEIVAFTALSNHRSQALMQRLGMRACPAEAFDHPGVPVGHPVRAHCLYRLARADWRGTDALFPKPSHA